MFRTRGTGAGLARSDGRLGTSHNRLLASALLLISLLTGSNLHAQSVEFTMSAYFGTAGTPIDITVETRDGLSNLVDGGTLAWDISACSSNPVFQPDPPPAAPAAGGQTTTQLLFSTSDSCSLDIAWDPDGGGTQPPVSASLKPTVFVDPAPPVASPITPLNQTVTPFASGPSFIIEVRQNGSTLSGAFVRWEVQPPGMGTPLSFGDECFSSSYATGADGRSTLDLNALALPPDQLGVWNVTAYIGGSCDVAAGKRRGQPGGFGTKGGSFSITPIAFQLTVEDVQVGFQSPPSGLVAGSTGNPLTVLVSGQSTGSPLSGVTVDFFTSPSTTLSPSSGSAVTNASGLATFLVDAGVPDLMGGLVDAQIQVPLSSPVSRSDSLSLMVTSYDLALETPAPTGTVFGEEVAPGIAVRATTNTGNTDDPEGGVLIRFQITTGDAVFESNNSTQADVTTASIDGIARSPDIRIGRSSGNVTVTATDTGGLHKPDQSQTYNVTPSSYTLDPASDSLSGFAGQSFNLPVILTRDGSSLDQPVGGATLIWSVSPATGATLTDSSTSTDPGGNTSNSFQASAAGTYTVTASFDPGLGASFITTSTFTISIAAPTLNMVADGQPAGPNYTEETTSSGLTVLATDTAGANTTPAADVPVTFTITGGSATFTDGSTVAGPINTGGEGRAFSPSLIIGRDTTGVTVEATAAGRPTVTFTLPVIASTYTLAPSSDNRSGVIGESLDLPVTLTRTGSGPAQPVGAASLSWSISPATGATLTDSSTSTDPGGNTSNSFQASAAGTYTVTASFDPGLGASFITTSTLTINIAAPTLNMVADGQPAGPNYTEETTSSGLTVLATDTLDGVTSPTPAVPVTFTITSGTATFTSGGTAAGPINTLADGRASSPPIQVQRGSTNVVVEASATGRPTVIFSIAVTASTYVLSAERTPVSQQITRSGSASLAVQLQRSGSSVQPLQNASIDWTVSPADGSSLDPSVAITDALGVGSTLFRPAAAGRYTVTASFNTGGAGKTTVSQAFTIDVVDDQRRLDAVSGDGQSGEPGSNLSEPLVVQALENGQPAAGARIEWSGSGGVLLRGAQGVPNSVITELTGTDGRSSVDVTLPPAPGSFVITATWMQHTRNKTSAPVGLSVSFTVSAGAPATPSLEIVDGNDQRGVVGTPGSPLSARLLLNGRPASGFAVGWEVIEGDASISPSASTADAQGLVTTSLQFGAQTGQSTIRVASGLGVEAFFTVTAIAPPTIRISSGDGQRGAPNVALAGDLIVQVTTQTGQPVPGLAVGWSALEGDGSLAFATTTTDANGLASNRLTLGPQLGNNIIAATLANGSQVVFSATAVNGDGTGDVRLMREGGDGQRGLVGTRLPVPLSAKLLEGGQPVPQARIFWEVLSGSARVDASETLTNDNGVARVAVILGANAEPVQIRASASAAPDPVLFNLSAVNPEVAGQEGSGQAGTVGQPLPMDIAVNLVLPAGKTLAGVPVQWRVLTGGGALTAQQSLSDANGRASNQWTLGSEVGVQSAIATLPGGEELVFTANANPEQVVGSLAVVSGSPQSLPPNVPSQPLVVELRDQNGEPLAGVGIEWSGSEQRVALRDSITTTGQDGRASNVATVLVPGPASVSARVVGGDIAAVNFDLNGGVAEIPGLSDEERDIGTVVDNACPALAALPNRTPEQQDLFQRCSEFVGNAGEHPDEVRNALGQLPTDIGPTLSGQANESVGTQMDNLDLRLHMIRGEKTGAQRNQFNLSLWTPDGALPLSFLPSAFMAAAASDEDQAGLDFDRWGFFATGQIGRGQVDAGARSPEFDYDIAGLTFGADYRFNDRLVAGLALGYSDNDAELAGSRGDVATKGWTLSGYATWYSTTAWYVDGTLLLGRLDYDLRRRLSYSITGLDGGRTIVDQVASASTDGDLLGASISIGRDWQKGPWNVNGYFRGQYARVKTDAFVERMIEGLPGQGLALAVDSRSTESMTSAFGVRATYVLSRDWGILMPNASIEWEHEFEDDPGRLTARLAFDPTATPIERFGDALDSDYFNLGIGLSALFPGGRSAYLFYEELVGASRIRQGLLSLGVRLEF